MRRAIGSVVLDQGVAERIRSDVMEFMGRGKWYFERGAYLVSCSCRNV